MIGKNSSLGNVSASYSSGIASGTSNVLQTIGLNEGGGASTSLSPSSMRSQSSFPGWDFTNTWRIVEGSSYPMLRVLTQGKINLSASARNIEKVYDKTAWSGGIIDYSGFTGGDTASSLSGTLQWGGTAQGAINAGNYSLIPTGLYSQKYEVTYTSGTLTIQPRPVSLSVSKTYNANASFDSGFAVTDGVLAGDLTPTITGTASVSSANAGTYTSFANNQLVSNNPNYTPNPLYAYSGSLGKISANINPAALSMLGVSGSRIYDGTRAANWNDNTQLLGVLPADQGKVALVSGSGLLRAKDVGTQELISIGSLSIGGTAASNYTLGTSGSSWNIQPANLVFTTIADSKVYDGGKNATGLVKLINGELYANDEIVGPGMLAFDNANAGKDKVVNASGITVNDGNGGRNYNINYRSGNASISPRPVDVVVRKTYDGDASFNSGFSVSSGVQGADAIPIISGTATVSSANAGSYSAFTVNKLVSNDPNYIVSGSSSVNATIDRAALFLSLTGSRSYDGTTNANWNDNVSLFGGGRTFEADRSNVKIVSGAGVLASKNAGRQALTSTGTLTLGGNAAGNYFLSTEGSYWVISPAEILFGAKVNSKVYDANTTATGEISKIGGHFFGSDTWTGGILRFADVNAGRNKQVNVSDILVSDGNGGRNYIVSYLDGSGSITPRPLDLFAESETRIYNGTDISTQLFRVQGLASGDTIPIREQAFVSSAAMGTNKSTIYIKKYQINDGNNGANYAVTTHNAVGTITPLITDPQSNVVPAKNGEGFTLLGTLNDITNNSKLQVLEAGADYITNLNDATKGIVGLENVNNSSRKLLNIIRGAEQGDIDSALKDFNNAMHALKNPNDLLGKSAKFVEGAGHVLQIVKNFVVLGNSFSHSLDGSFNVGDQNDLYLASSYGIPGVNVVVAAVTSPFELGALAIELASGGSIDKALTANLDRAKSVNVQFNSYVDYLATNIANGSVSIEDARYGFDVNKNVQIEALVSIRDQYRNIPGATTLALTGHMGDTNRVIDAINKAKSAISSVDFPTVMKIAVAKKFSN
ncbi:YDG domain-containing protein [Undibacterium danionis]|uniref:YDG domain-containing protein n=1 Tax=Undibacterium danionis TaxID=1812100 RepID=A0ABV6IDJ8_9BURK